MRYTAILILNYNNSDDTINCIESIERYNTSPIKYIVVDNCSTRVDAVSCLKNYFKDKFKNDFKKYEINTILELPLTKLSFIVNDRNEGYAKGNNIGLNLIYQDPEIVNIMILNNDILFVEDIIPPLINKLYTIPNCGLISPLLYKKNLKELDYNCARLNCTVWEIILTYLLWYRDVFGYLSKINKRRFLLKNKIISDIGEFIDIELPSGSCMMGQKTTFKEIGGFDSNTFLYYEENILYKKLNRIGKSNYLLLGIKCVHLGASSTKHTASEFILRTGLDSSIYYINSYCNPSIIQRIFINLAKWSFSIKLFLLRIKK